LGLVYVPGIGKAALVGGLVLLAVAKAALVLLFFMHLGNERRALKLSVLLPFLLPAVYALVLVGDALWRLS
jgi:caa(3)-type oxidase subunit IV